MLYISSIYVSDVKHVKASCGYLSMPLAKIGKYITVIGQIVPKVTYIKDICNIIS